MTLRDLTTEIFKVPEEYMDIEVDFRMVVYCSCGCGKKEDVKSENPFIAARRNSVLRTSQEIKDGALPVEKVVKFILEQK